MIIAAKRLSGYLNRFAPEKRAIIRNCLIIVVLWSICMFWVSTGYPFTEILMLLGLFIPFAIFFSTASFYWLLPAARVKRYPFPAYVIRSFLLLLITFIPFCFLTMLFLNNAETSIMYAVLNSFFQFFLVLPLSWYWYKRQVKGDDVIKVLEKELHQSTASLRFLRSQINPHFLFNALNTIYGTALQENAARTSEGIEKLGDMMRFMLQENLQEKIPVARELDYLDNYISLQRLRTDPNPAVKIEISLDRQLNNIEISPMLLIPFVENAFKHGISFRNPSYIKVTLKGTPDALCFEVYNSLHKHETQDPENNQKGIGLLNVKQRLQLLYPNKHELVIRETGKEFSVNLTLKTG